MPWGEVNRYQRNDGAIVQAFDDAKPSIPRALRLLALGLARIVRRPSVARHRRYYGTSGNSFVAVVEFGKKVSARAITVGGESGQPQSPHFSDEAERYTTGNFRAVYFWPDKLKSHVERAYHPGE